MALVFLSCCLQYSEPLASYNSHKRSLVCYLPACFMGAGRQEEERNAICAPAKHYLSSDTGEIVC